MDKKLAREIVKTVADIELAKIRRLNEKMKILQEKIAKTRKTIAETNRHLDDLIEQLERRNNAYYD